MPACGFSATIEVFSPIADDDASIVFAIDNSCDVTRHFYGIITGKCIKGNVIKMV